MEEPLKRKLKHGNARGAERRYWGDGGGVYIETGQGPYSLTYTTQQGNPLGEMESVRTEETFSHE